MKGVPETVKKLKDSGKRFMYVTNSPLHTRKELSNALQAMGYDANPEEVVCTSHLVATYLKSINFNKKVYLIGCNGIGQELDAVGIPHIGIGVGVNTQLTLICYNSMKSVRNVYSFSDGPCNSRPENGCPEFCARSRSGSGGKRL